MNKVELINSLKNDLKNAGFPNTEKENSFDYAMLQSVVGSVIRWKGFPDQYLSYTTHGPKIKDIVAKYL